MLVLMRLILILLSLLIVFELCYRHCPGKEDEEIVKRRPLSSAGVYTALEQQKGERRYFATR